MEFLREGQNAIRRDISSSLAWEASRHFSVAERDAQVYIRDNTLRDEMISDRADSGSITEQRGSDSSAFILAFMLDNEIEHSVAGTIKPANPNISDFIEDGLYGFSWRALSELYPEDALRAFHQVPSRGKLEYLFGPEGILKSSTELERITSAFENLYYPVSLTGPMETLEELSQYSVPTELLVLAYEATSDRAETFLAAQEELRRPLLAAAFERLDAFRRIEIAYANLMLASLSSASSQIDNYVLHNINVGDIRPSTERLESLFNEVRALDAYGVEQLDIETDFSDRLWYLKELPPRKELQSLFSSTYDGGHGVAPIGASFADTLGLLDSGQSSGSVYALHRAERLGLVRVREANEDQDTLYRFPYADPETREVWGYRTYGTLPITFDGWVWITEKSSVPGVKDYSKLAKGEASGTLYYSQVIEYLSSEVTSASDFSRTRHIGSYTIPSSDNPNQGILGYRFEEVRAQRWKPLGGHEVHEMNQENQAAAEAELQKARAMEDIWTRALEETLRGRAEDNRSDIVLWFEGMLSATRDAQLSSALNQTQTEKTFGVFFADNVVYPPTPGVTEIRDGKVWQGGYSFAFDDGRKFVLKQVTELEKAVRDIEALNWYIAYALSAAYGDCWYGSQALTKDVVLTLPTYVRHPESVIAGLEDIYRRVPKRLLEDFVSAYKSLEELEKLEALSKEGLLTCDPTHRVELSLDAMKSAFGELERFDIAKRLGTVFALSELN